MLSTLISPARAAIAVAFIVFIAAIVIAVGQDRPYQAEAEVAITPISTATGEAASFSDTLSRGTVVATFAQAFAAPVFVDAALAQSNLTAAQVADIRLSTRVVAGTSIIAITGQASDPELAVLATQAIASAGPELGGYTAAFQPRLISPAEQAVQVGPSPTDLLVIGVLAAIAAGAFTLVGLGRLQRRDAAAAAPAGVTNAMLEDAAPLREEPAAIPASGRAGARERAGASSRRS